MGIVYKQAFSNTIYSVVGIAAGAINTLFILPRAFEEAPDDLGLIRVLLAQATIFGTVFGLGLSNVIIRENTQDKSEEYKRSILSFTLIFTIVGFSLLAILLNGFPTIFSHLINPEEAARLITNINSLILLCLSIIFNQYLSNYIVNMHKSPFVQFINDPFLKITYLALTAIYLLKPFSFDLFLKLFVMMYVTSSFLLLLYSIFLGFRPKFNWALLKIKELFTFSFYTIIDRGAGLIVNNLDLVMLGIMLNLENVGIYSIAFFIGAVISIPQRAILTPSLPLVSGFLKKKDLPKLQKLYKQTSINQLLIGGVIFVLIWSNIDSLFSFMPGKFSEKWVVFFIGLTRLFVLSTGVSGPIIVYSKYYRTNIIFNLLLIGIAIVSNYYLIPEYGMTGAAVATAITYAIYNIIKSMYVWSKFRIQPFDASSVKVVVVIIISLICNHFINFSIHPILSIAVKSAIIVSIMLILFKILRVKAEMLDIIPIYKKI